MYVCMCSLGEHIFKYGRSISDTKVFHQQPRTCTWMGWHIDMDSEGNKQEGRPIPIVDLVGIYKKKKKTESYKDMMMSIEDF